jgi:hypothetical protein
VKQSGLQNMQSFVIACHQWLERNYGDANPEEEMKKEEDEGEQIPDSSCELWNMSSYAIL